MAFKLSFLSTLKTSYFSPFFFLNSFPYGHVFVGFSYKLNWPVFGCTDPIFVLKFSRIIFAFRFRLRSYRNICSSFSLFSAFHCILIKFPLPSEQLHNTGLRSSIRWLSWYHFSAWFLKSKIIAPFLSFEVLFSFNALCFSPISMQTRFVRFSYILNRRKLLRRPLFALKSLIIIVA